jgi:hypothetical protein
MYTYFVLYNTGPIILINVFDPAATPKVPVVDAAATLSAGRYELLAPDVMLDTIIVKNSTGTPTYTKDVDYTAAYTQDVTVTITRIPGGLIPTDTNALKPSYTQANPSDRRGIIGDRRRDRKCTDRRSSTCSRASIVPHL